MESCHDPKSRRPDDRVQEIVATIAAEYEIEPEAVRSLPGHVVDPMVLLVIALYKARESYLKHAENIHRATVELSKASGSPSDTITAQSIASLIGPDASRAIFRKTAPYVQEQEILEGLLTEALMHVHRKPIS